MCVNFRSRYHKLKYGTDLDLGDMTPPSFDKDANGLQHFFINVLSQIRSSQNRINRIQKERFRTYDYLKKKIKT